MMHALELSLGHERIAGLQAGSDSKTAILLCHGNSGCAELYRELLDSSVSRTHRLIAISFPGHGRSARSASPESTYSIPGLADLLPLVVRQLELEHYVLVGHSLGGHVLSTALESLPGARGLMLISAPPLRRDSFAEIFKPDPTGGALFKGVLSEAEADAFCNALLSPGVVMEPLAERVREAVRDTDPAFREALGASVAVGRVADERHALASTRVPTALAYGARDRLNEPQYYEQVRLRTGWRGGLFPFAESGHSPHLEATGDFLRLFEQFIKDVSNPTAKPR